MADVKRDNERAKIAASDLTDALNFERQMETDVTKQASDTSKELLELDRRLMKTESALVVLKSSLDTKVDGLEFVNLQEKMEATEGLTVRVDKLEHKVGFIDETFSDQLDLNPAIYGPDPIETATATHVHLVTRSTFP